MLVTPRGRLNGPAFIIGWWLGLAIVGTIVFAVAGGADASSDGTSATWVNWLNLILGVLLLLLGTKQWKGRPEGERQPVMPRWMGAREGSTPAKALGAG